MKATNKKLLVAGAAVVAVVAGILIIRKKKQSTGLLGTGGPGVPQAGTRGLSSRKIDGVLYPLKQGSGYSNTSEKAAVKKLQQALNMKINLKAYLGIEQLDVDGKFGPKTEAATVKILGVKQVSYSLYQELLAKTTKTIFGLMPAIF